MIQLITLHFGLACCDKALNIKYYASLDIQSNIPIKELITSDPSYLQQILKFIEKSSTNTLEEILNTAQTEEIIKIIKSFDQYSIENEGFKKLTGV